MTKHLRSQTALCALLFGATLGTVCATPTAPIAPAPASTTEAESARRPPASERQFFGPLVASGESPASPASPHTHYTAVRPLWLRQQTLSSSDTSDGPRLQPIATQHSILYPLFSYRKTPEGTLDWSLFNLINFSRSPAPPLASSLRIAPTRFDLWPVYFSNQTGTPATSYRALFPIAGHIKARFGYDSLQWVLFPLSLRSEKAGRVTHSALWPIFKKRSGDGHTGLTLWPLFNLAEKPGSYRDQSFLWPLIYNNVRYDPATGEIARRTLGVLPLYTRETRPGSLSESYLWPFFGYTHQAAPLAPYRETRYLWPLFVQARGPQHTINRWAPFYSHSIRRNGHTEKRWFLWPLFRHETWQGQGLLHSKDQLLFFLYSSERQRSATHPELPAAHKTHLWPLISTWDDGAGRAQTQLLSPLAIFFPNNEKIRLLYNPLFALYRRDQRRPDDIRHEVLWRAITWRRDGPARELRILGSTLGLRKNPTTGKWRPFLFDFSRKNRSLPFSSPSPTAATYDERATTARPIKQPAAAPETAPNPATQQ